jgi:hypothetical protein
MKNPFSTVRRALGIVVVAISILTSVPVIAQMNLATLSGSVVDHDGALIPGAHITARNTATGVERTVESGKEGSFRLLDLSPGTYNITAVHPGFEQVEISNVPLNIGDEKSLTLKMTVGAESQHVEVTADQESVTSTAGSVSTLISQQFVKNLPLNGRSFQDLILLTPGVVTTSPQVGLSNGNSGQFSINGQTLNSNSYQVDGVSANTGTGGSYGYSGIGNAGSLPSNTALGTTQSLLSVDALQEFRVESSSYSAEYGRTPGGQISFLSKAGTNQLHGSAFDYLRNNFFDANDWFNDYYNVPMPALRQNDFGGTFSGPIVIPKLYDGRKHTFFFFSYEGLRLEQPQAAGTTYVPTVALRNSTPSALRAFLDTFPVPNATSVDLGDGLSTYIASSSGPSTINSTSGRLDETFSQKLNGFVRISDTSSKAQRASGNLAENYFNAAAQRSYTAGLTFLPTSSIVNDLKANFTSSIGYQGSFYTTFGGATPPTDVLSAADYPQTGPSYSLNFGFYFSTGSASSSYYNGATNGRQLNVVDTLTFVKGRHSIKAGADYRRITAANFPDNPIVTYEYYSAASVTSNNADEVSANVSTPNFPTFNELSLFVQDEWKVDRKFTLSTGLRWELEPPASIRHGLAPTTLINQNNLSELEFAPDGTPLYDTTYYNFAPRLGASYSLNSRPGRETVIRGGAGIFFDTGTSQSDSLSGFYNPGFSTTASYCAYSYCSVQRDNNPFPLTPAEQLPPVQYPAQPPYTSNTPYASSTHLALPYTWEWNVGAEQALSRKDTVSVTYVGSAGRKLIAVDTIYVAPENPDFNYIALANNGLQSAYQSLQIVYQRRPSAGVQVYAAYTLSHAQSFNRTNDLLPYELSDSPTDVRNNFNAAVSWEPTLNSPSKFARSAVNGWGIDLRESARSAFPLNINGQYDPNPAQPGSGVDEAVNYVPGQPVYIKQPSAPGGRVINRAAFTSSTIGVPGNVPYYSLRGFDAIQTTLDVRRDFPIYRSLKLQFRAEAFNLFNHPAFGYIDNYLPDVTFGEATNSLANAIGGAGTQYAPGGARSMQFALKLFF